jgi:hypothetical protein
MNDSTGEISPLRQRMLEDMRLRKLAPQTQATYVRSVRRLAAYLRRAPDTATVEDLRNFQLHLVDRGTSPITPARRPTASLGTCCCASRNALYYGGDSIVSAQRPEALLRNWKPRWHSTETC